MTRAGKPVGDMTPAEKRQAAYQEYRAVYGMAPRWAERPADRKVA